MKKNLVRIFSLMMAAMTALSMSAAPLAKRNPSGDTGNRTVSAVAAPASDKPVATKGAIPMPKVRQTASANVFASASRSVKPANVKAPFKVGAMAEELKLPNLIGSVLYSDAFSANGVYTVPTKEGQEFERLFRYANAQYGGVLVGDIYYVCQYYDSPWGAYKLFLGYDVNTGNEVYDVTAGYYTYTMTYDETSQQVYAIANVSDYFVLTTVNFDMEHKDVSFNPIGTLAIDQFGIWNAIACDSKGQLWGVLSNLDEEAYATSQRYVCTGSTLYKIDKATGEATKVGETGYDSLYASDAIFDTKTDRMLWTVYNTAEQGFLTEIDTTTGAATVLFQFPGNEEVTGLAIMPPLAEDNAPAAVSGVTANFAGSSLTGTIDFTAPSTLFAGGEPTGQMTYTVTANGETAATGTAEYGAEVKAEVTVATAGFYKFSVKVSNEAGDSPSTEVSSYVGADTPEATKVTARYADGVMTVTWLPVKASVNGGFIDLNAVTYTVTRYPGAVKVAEDFTATTFTENIAVTDDMISYYYTVTATAEGLTSEVAQSNIVTLGSVTPPYVATFDDDQMNGFKAVDANYDDMTWICYDGHARIMWNSSLAMDDWLMSPGVKLLGGKIYDISAEFAVSNANFAERVEVKVGKADEPGAMTTVLLEPTQVTSLLDNPYHWSATFVPEADGIYYFGIHGISDKDKMYLYADNFAVSAPKVADGPAAVGDLTATPGANGALTATISFVTPDKTLGGKPLDELMYVNLMRDGSVINTWTAPAMGATLTYTDNLPSSGTYTYTVVSVNADGTAPEAVATTFVGVDYPAPLTGLVAFETENPGEVTLEWDAVTTTESGGAIDETMVTYQVYRIINGTPNAVSGRLTATTYTYQAVAAGSQEFVQFVVYPFTDRGNGQYGLSDFFPAGTPYNGLTLTNQDDFKKYIFGVNGAGGGEWAMYDDNLLPSQDCDNGMAAMYGRYEDTSAELYTGLVSLDAISNPGLTFYTYNIGDMTDDLGNPLPDINEITVGVKVKGENEFTPVKHVVVSETGPANSWNRISVDLSDYVGKVIQVSLDAVVKAASYTLVDNLKIGTVLADDLSVMAISAPKEVTAGTEYQVAVNVLNEGMNDAAAYTVELYADGEAVASKKCEALAAGTSDAVVFDILMSPLAEDEVTLTATVVMTSDMNDSNNSSESIEVTPVASTLPAATDLDATVEAGRVKLTWNSPDINALPADAVTEDFENGLGFTSRYGDWIFADMDNSPVDGFQDIQLPNITEGVTKGSFWLWDANTTGNSTTAAHSGTKYLFSLYRADFGAANDWAISPELDGSAQTISFYARSYSGNYPEKMRILYSTGGIEPADFIEGATYYPVPAAWTRYEFKVPAGAKRFAINSCAQNAFMFMVDDVTYIPEGAEVTTSLVGYDVYRDGAKINDATVDKCEYTDSNVTEGTTYSYAVVAVYNKGLGSASNVVTVNDMSGIDSIAADNLDAEFFNLQGQRVAKPSAGIYIMRIGSTVKKVLVK